jgi:hypothetical protein
MVYRVYVEKKKGLENEANALFSEIKTFLGIKDIEKVRMIYFLNPLVNQC